VVSHVPKLRFGSDFFKSPAFVASCGWIARLTSAAAAIISIKILLGKLGTSEFAAFNILASLAVWFNLLDFGIGAAMQNYFSESRARSASPYAVIKVAGLILLGMLVVASFASWIAAPAISSWMFGQLGLFAQDAVLAFRVAAICLCVNALTALGYRLWFARHLGYLSMLLPALASIVSLLGLSAWASQTHGGSLVLVAVIMFLPTALFSALAFVLNYIRALKDSEKGEPFSAGSWIRRAAKFAVFALMAAITLQVDFLIMSQNTPAAEIAAYALCGKFFGLVAFLTTSIISAQMPHFTENYIRREEPLLRKKLRHLTIFTIAVSVLATVVLYFFIPFFLAFGYYREGLTVPVPMIILAGAYAALQGVVSVYSGFLQSISSLDFFLFATPVQMVLSATLQYYLSHTFGAIGIQMGLIIACALTALWLCPLFSHKKLSGLSRQPV
jgi:O-antigen/teichoic acid export membrane protein